MIDYHHNTKTKPSPQIQRLIIGYGNEMRGDDGVGFIIAKTLAKLFHHQSGIQVIACRQLTPELVTEIIQTEKVIFIDANADHPAGTITRTKLSYYLEEQHSMTHYQSPTELLQMCRILYHHTPEAEFISIAGKHFTFGKELSKEVLDSAHILIKQLSLLP